jgi:uncharacterized protein (DUF1697 family)
MTRQIALLRGINVGGNRRLGMADLRALMVQLGYADARTHLQSGNVVFTASEVPEAAANRIEARIRADLGLDVSVLGRTRDDFAAIVAGNPLREYALNPSRHLVVFLSAAADPAVIRGIDAARYEPERFSAHGREIHMWLPEGVQSARLTQAFWEKRLGAVATARNWNTVERLLALADEQG